MPINSKRKGASGERTFAEYLRSHGYKARRGVQYSGSPNSPDVVCEDLPIHFEVKNCERLNIYDAVAQAEQDCPKGKYRVVAHKKNRGDWVAIMPMDDLMDLLDELRFAQGKM